jgi:hypothetical protein
MKKYIELEGPSGGEMVEESEVAGYLSRGYTMQEVAKKKAPAKAPAKKGKPKADDE